MNMLTSTNRVVMISGANRGIGKAIAERLYEEGYTLSLGVRRPESLHRVTSHMDPSRVAATRYEATERASAQRWVAATVERFDRIDAIVNNAGVMYSLRLEDYDEDKLDQMWAVNAKGPLRLIRHAFPHLKRSGSGRIINIASLSGKRVASESTGAYAMTKFAVSALTQMVRYAGWDYGIRATAICPGYVATDMTADVASIAREDMIEPLAVAHLVCMVLALPNPASVVEVPINCRLEHSV